MKKKQCYHNPTYTKDVLLEIFFAQIQQSETVGAEKCVNPNTTIEVQCFGCLSPWKERNPPSFLPWIALKALAWRDERRNFDSWQVNPERDNLLTQEERVTGL